MIPNKEKERIRKLSDLIYSATKSIRILSHISWSDEVREEFFANGARKLPQVNYPAFDCSVPLAVISEARRLIGTSSVDQWFGRQCDAIESSAKLLSSCGSRDYFKYSCELYGTPLDVLPDQMSTPHALASQFDKQLETFSAIDLGAPAPACHLAGTVASEMESAVQEMFGGDAPQVQVVDELSANALAGPKRIRIRRTACFTDNDIGQLVNHEAYIHVATSINGLAQTDLKILGAAHPGTTKTQEGLAVFAELITGSMDLDRMRRLADRVLAIQMAIEGADFLDIYGYFLERIHNREQAFENARRVFRGGTVDGGTAFTKDIVYLDGLLRVHNFLHAIVTSGRADCLRLLFCGKLDIDDIPVIYELHRQGLCQDPRYLPPWAADMRFLLVYLSYSAFLGDMDFPRVKLHYDELLASIPGLQE